jgi:hypothetical protein
MILMIVEVLRQYLMVRLWMTGRWLEMENL